MTPLASQTTHYRRHYNEDLSRSRQHEVGEIVHLERHQEENNNVPLPDRGSSGSFNFSLMMIFFLGGCGAALAIIPIMVSCEEQTETFLVQNYDIVYVINSSFMALMTLICVFFLVRRRKWIADGHLKVIVTPNPALRSNFGSLEQLSSTMSTEGYSHLQQPNVLESRISRLDQISIPYAVVCFGIGSFLYRACSIVNNIYKVFKTSSFHSSLLYNNIHLVGDILVLIANIVHVLFIVRFKKLTFRNCALFHYLIALWIGGGLLLWFSLSLSPVYSVITESCHNTSRFDVVDQDDSTTVEEALEILLTFLKPFSVEFSTICIGVFLNLWNKFDNNASVKQERVNNLASEVDPDYLNQDVSRLSLEEDAPESERHYNTKKSNHAITRRMIFVLPFLVSLFYVILFVIGHYTHGKHNIVTNVYLWNGIRVLIHLLLLIFFVPTWRAMTKYNIRLKLASLTSFEIVLIGTHTGNYVIFFFRFFSTLSLLISYEPNDLGNKKLVFMMIFSCLCMIDVWCATYYILAMKSLQRSGRKMTNFDKFGLTYNATIHLAEWAMFGLAHEWAPQSKHYLVPAMAAAFGDMTVRLATLVVYPIMEFYRFHAAVVCFETAKNI